MSECLRCGKKDVYVHTCNPSPSYRAGIVEGLEMATEYFRAVPAKNSKQTMYDALKELIKKYQEPSTNPINTSSAASSKTT